MEKQIVQIDGELHNIVGKAASFMDRLKIGNCIYSLNADKNISYIKNIREIEEKEATKNDYWKEKARIDEIKSIEIGWRASINSAVAFHNQKGDKTDLKSVMTTAIVIEDFIQKRVADYFIDEKNIPVQENGN